MEPGTTVLYGLVGEARGKIVDPEISEARLFSEPPEKLVFGLEECLLLLERGCGYLHGML
jgi:hypothetical protein